MYNKKNSFFFFQYFYNCDTINKYNILSIYTIPLITKLKISFLLDFFQSNLLEISNEYNTRTKAFFLYYLITNYFPSLNFIKLKNNLNKMLFNTTFCLSQVINKQQSINSFLINFFFEILPNIDEKSFVLKNTKNLIILKIFLPVCSFKNLAFLLNTELFYFLKNDFVVQLEFFINKDSIKTFNWQTLSLFWK
jgi:hypothetical protein